jgi:pilus assembly protein CpaB
MSARTLVLLLFALIAAGGTAFLARGYLNSQKAVVVETQAPEPEKQGVQVLVAAENLPIGTFLREDHLRWQLWPEDSLSDQFLTEDAVKMEDMVGAVVRTGILDGEPITTARVVKPGDRGFLAAVLEPGTRAMTVEIDDASGVAGFVFPGDRVDLLLSHEIVIKYQTPGETKEKSLKRQASVTVLENVRVLAIDQALENPEGTPDVGNTATLELTPKQAEAVSVAAEMGVLSLSLRSLRGGENELAASEGFKHLADASGWDSAGSRHKQSYSWDSDISPVLNDPEELTGLGANFVTVFRGSESMMSSEEQKKK